MDVSDIFSHKAILRSPEVGVLVRPDPAAPSNVIASVLESSLPNSLSDNTSERSDVTVRRVPVWADTKLGSPYGHLLHASSDDLVWRAKARGDSSLASLATPQHYRRTRSPTKSALRKSASTQRRQNRARFKHNSGADVFERFLGPSPVVPTRKGFLLLSQHSRSPLSNRLPGRVNENEPVASGSPARNSINTPDLPSSSIENSTNERGDNASHKPGDSAQAGEDTLSDAQTALANISQARQHVGARRRVVSAQWSQSLHRDNGFHARKKRRNSLMPPPLVAAASSHDFTPELSTLGDGPSFPWDSSEEDGFRTAHEIDADCCFISKFVRAWMQETRCSRLWRRNISCLVLDTLKQAVRIRCVQILRLSWYFDRWRNVAYENLRINRLACGLAQVFNTTLLIRHFRAWKNVHKFLKISRVTAECRGRLRDRATKQLFLHAWVAYNRQEALARRVWRTVGVKIAKRYERAAFKAWHWYASTSRHVRRRSLIFYAIPNSAVPALEPPPPHEPWSEGCMTLFDDLCEDDIEMRVCVRFQLTTLVPLAFRTWRRFVLVAKQERFARARYYGRLRARSFGRWVAALLDARIAAAEARAKSDSQTESKLRKFSYRPSYVRAREHALARRAQHDVVMADANRRHATLRAEQTAVQRDRQFFHELEEEEAAERQAWLKDCDSFFQTQTQREEHARLNAVASFDDQWREFRLRSALYMFIRLDDIVADWHETQNETLTRWCLHALAAQVFERRADGFNLRRHFHAWRGYHVAQSKNTRVADFRVLLSAKWRHFSLWRTFVEDRRTYRASEHFRLIVRRSYIRQRSSDLMSRLGDRYVERSPAAIFVRWASHTQDRLMRKAVVVAYRDRRRLRLLHRAFLALRGLTPSGSWSMVKRLASEASRLAQAREDCISALLSKDGNLYSSRLRDDYYRMRAMVPLVMSSDSALERCLLCFGFRTTERLREERRLIFPLLNQTYRVGVLDAREGEIMKAFERAVAFGRRVALAQTGGAANFSLRVTFALVMWLFEAISRLLPHLGQSDIPHDPRYLRHFSGLEALALLREGRWTALCETDTIRCPACEEAVVRASLEAHARNICPGPPCDRCSVRFGYPVRFRSEQTASHLRRHAEADKADELLRGSRALIGMLVEKNSVIVAGVTPGGPADIAGFQAGDVVRKWAGEKAVTAAVLKEKLDTSIAGTQVDVEVYRSGVGVMNLTLVLAAKNIPDTELRRLHAIIEVFNADMVAIVATQQKAEKKRRWQREKPDQLPSCPE